MKILFAIKSMDHVHGGAERVLANVTAGLIEKGHDVALISFDKPGGRSVYPLHEKLRRLSLGIGNSSKKSNFYETLLRMQALRRIVQDEKPDTVVAFMHSMFVPMGFSLIGAGVPVIGSEHIVPEHYRSRRFEFFLLVLSSFFLKKMTVLSEKVKALYPKFLHSKMVVMPNPVFKDSAAEASRKNKRKTLLNVARLDPQKDQETLIKAFAFLAKDFPDWDLRIIGEGYLRLRLEALIAENKLEGRVFLPGTISAIAQEYRQADIFVMPSLYESFGLATAEAMSFGLPAIGFSDCPGTNEIIVHGRNGLLVSGHGRAQVLAVGLKELMESPERRLEYGAQAREDVQKYSFKNVMQSWEDLIGSATPQNQ